MYHVKSFLRICCGNCANIVTRTKFGGKENLAFKTTFIRSWNMKSIFLQCILGLNSLKVLWNLCIMEKYVVKLLSCWLIAIIDRFVSRKRIFWSNGQFVHEIFILDGQLATLWIRPQFYLFRGSGLEKKTEPDYEIGIMESKDSSYRIFWKWLERAKLRTPSTSWKRSI